MYVVCCVFFVFCCVVGAVEVRQHTTRHVTWPFFLLMAIISIMLVAQADGQVTRVERTETHLVIASGWDSGWPIPIDRIDAVGVRRKVPFAWLQFGVVADCVGVRTTLRDHKCGASVRSARPRGERPAGTRPWAGGESSTGASQRRRDVHILRRPVRATNPPQAG